MSGDSETKTKPASKRKLAKQREEGSIPQSGELSAMMASALAVFAMILLFPLALKAMEKYFDLVAQLTTQSFTVAAPLAVAGSGRLILLLVLPVSAVALLTGILITLIYNRGFVFAIKPILPNFERISPKSGFKRIYGKRGWIETGQALVRILLWFAAAGLVLWSMVPSIFNYRDCGASCHMEIAQLLVLILCPIAIGILMISGGLDMLVQRFLFLDEQKMSHSEVKRENKEQAGAPEIKKERKRRRKDMGQQGESVGVAKANMCFFDDAKAVAIRYHPEHAPLPRVAAKAQTLEDAVRLRDAVRANGFTELKAPVIVAACVRVAPGDPVPEAAFEDLAAGMQKLFGGTSL